MGASIIGSNLSSAWVAGLEFLIACGGRAVNLVTTIKHPQEEDRHVRDILDKFIEERQEQGVGLADISGVADLIFPVDYYHQKLGTEARARLYELEAAAFPALIRQPGLPDTYFHRMVAWPANTKPLNQLDRLIERIKSELSHTATKSSRYELSVYHPEIDTRIMGFPCLSYISLTLLNRQLHMAAIYRNQHFVRKAYGNYVGLAHLLCFLCQEAGCNVGEIVCIATHADAEFSFKGVGKKRIEILAQACRKVLPTDEQSATSRHPASQANCLGSGTALGSTNQSRSRRIPFGPAGASVSFAPTERTGVS